jgi:hypothetical protein
MTVLRLPPRTPNATIRLRRKSQVANVFTLPCGSAPHPEFPPLWDVRDERTAEWDVSTFTRVRGFHHKIRRLVNLWDVWDVWDDAARDAHEWQAFCDLLSLHSTRCVERSSHTSQTSHDHRTALISLYFFYSPPANLSSHEISLSSLTSHKVRNSRKHHLPAGAPAPESPHLQQLCPAATVLEQHRAMSPHPPIDSLGEDREHKPPLQGGCCRPGVRVVSSILQWVSSLPGRIGSLGSFFLARVCARRQPHIDDKPCPSGFCSYACYKLPPYPPLAPHMGVKLIRSLNNLDFWREKVPP